MVIPVGSLLHWGMHEDGGRMQGRNLLWEGRGRGDGKEEGEGSGGEGRGYQQIHFLINWEALEIQF